MPVSMNTYSGFVQSINAYNPMVFVLEHHTKADSRQSEGSSKKIFMTTPIVLNSVTQENFGTSDDFSPDGGSRNVSRMSTNSMTRLSSCLLQAKSSVECDRLRDTHDASRILAIVKYTVLSSNSTRHFQSSQRSPGFHSARQESV